MEATGAAEKFHQSPLTGEFTNAALERDFRQAQWNSWAQQAGVAAALGTALVLLGGIADYLALGWNFRFLQIMALQATLLLPMAAILLASRQRNATLRLDLSIAFYELYLAAVLCIAIILRPAGAQYYTPSMLVLVLMYYLLVPNRFPLLLVCGFGTSIAYLAVLQQIFMPSADELALTVIIFLAVNLLGGFRALHLHHVHRQSFASLRQIAAINEKLQEEIKGRQRVSNQLQKRIQFEDLFTRLATRFINLRGEQIEPKIRDTLAELGEYSGVDRSYVFQFDPAQRRFSCTHEWCGSGVKPILPVMQALSQQAFSWAIPQLMRGETLCIPSVAQLPREAYTERLELERHGTRSLVLVPLHYNQGVTGFIGLGSVHAERDWSENSLLLLRVVGNILINALRSRTPVIAAVRRP
jgi:hypothetical protein